MSYIRSKLFDAVFVLWTILLAVVTPVLVVVKRPAWVRLISRIWSRGIILGIKYIVGLEHREIGRSNIPQGQVILACNHQSAWETLVFNVLIPDVCIVLKESLYNVPIFGWYLKHSPMIALNRAEGPQAIRHLMKQAIDVKADGRSILIFPEGTRQPLHANAPFNRGVALLYQKLKLPVVPVAINSGAFWATSGFMKYSGTITVSYLPPIPPGLPTDEFLRRLETAIKAERDNLIRNLDIATPLQGAE